MHVAAVMPLVEPWSSTDGTLTATNKIVAKAIYAKHQAALALLKRDHRQRVAGDERSCHPKRSAPMRLRTATPQLQHQLQHQLSLAPRAEPLHPRSLRARTITFQL